MAKLPSKYDLSGPLSLRSGRVIAQGDTSGFARGLASLGGSVSQIGSDIVQQQNAVDIARAEAFKTEGLLGTQNQFDADPDYVTFGERAPKATGEVVDKAANLIRDPRMRERWKAGALGDAARVNDSIADRGLALGKQAEQVAFDDGLEANRRLYVDPDTPEDVREKARQDIAGSIDMGEASGLFTPDEAKRRRDLFLDGADFNRAQLYAERTGQVPGDTDAAALLRRFEGFRPDPYWDVNADRVGYGSDTITRADGTVEKVTKGTKVTREDAERDLNRRIGEFQRGIQRDIGATAWSALPANAKAALTSVAYNYGSLPKSVVSAVQSGNMGEVANAVQALGSHNNGINAKRRAEEAAIIRGEGRPEWFKRLSPEQQFRITSEAQTRRNQISSEQRGSIDVAVQNAPAAIQNTGRYDGYIPTAQQFMDAYGPQEGAQRYSAFQTSMETSEQAYGMRTMSSQEIQDIVRGARPVSSGDNAALETKRFEVLTAAADATLKARNADPATYVQNNFPGVAGAWQQAAASGDYQPALSASAAAQQQLGIAPADMKLLPKSVADTAVATFKDANRPETDRIAAATGLIFSTPDKAQRQAVFEQLVDAGLPEETEGAFEAAARGDQGAAQRLFQAAMIDPKDLPGSSPQTPKAVDDAIQAQIMDEGQIGDFYYGLRYGQTENFTRAQRDAKLINNAVQVRIRRGEALDAAIEAVKKDLYGDVKPVTGGWFTGVNAELLLPTDQDPAPVLAGLEKSAPLVQEALSSVLAVDGKPLPDGSLAVTQAVKENYIANVMAEGAFRSVADGFVFIDPYTGAAVPGADGNPLVIGMDEVIAAGVETQPAPQPEAERDPAIRDLRQRPSGFWSLQ